MFRVPCNYKPDRHILVHPPLEGWMRRNVPDRQARDNLFVYFSVENLSYVIGLWQNKSRTAFLDVLNFGPWLHGFTWEDAQHLLRMFGRPLTGAELGEQARQEYLGRVRRQQDQADAEADRFRWERRTRALEVCP